MSFQFFNGDMNFDIFLHHRLQSSRVHTHIQFTHVNKSAHSLYIMVHHVRCVVLRTLSFVDSRFHYKEPNKQQLSLSYILLCATTGLNTFMAKALPCVCCTSQKNARERTNFQCVFFFLRAPEISRMAKHVLSGSVC
jgi:hypothetical protein